MIFTVVVVMVFIITAAVGMSGRALPSVLYHTVCLWAVLDHRLTVGLFQQLLVALQLDPQPVQLVHGLVQLLLYRSRIAEHRVRLVDTLHFHQPIASRLLLDHLLLKLLYLGGQLFPPLRRWQVAEILLQTVRGKIVLVTGEDTEDANTLFQLLLRGALPRHVVQPGARVVGL
uniref:Putative secreted peptide n=1 Tax=Anopheles braziliensis TaxID=58242 RepID=A0A2M3ZNV9_9DIPT